MSRKVSPAIAERDKTTVAARRALENRRRTLDQEEQRELIRVQREVRAAFRAKRTAATEEYDEVRDAAYAKAGAVVRQAERELAEYGAALDERTKLDLEELTVILKEREAKIRAAEKAKAEAAAPAAPVSAPAP